jgi:gliding motility-associated-like protein
VTFQELSLGASTLHWDFGDGTTFTSGPGDATHTYVNYTPGNAYHDVQLVAISPMGCTDTALTTIQVHPSVTAGFYTDTVGCSPLTLTLVDASENATSFVWDMGDGTVLTGATPTHTFINSTTGNQQFTVTQIAFSAYGCSDTATAMLTVYPSPSASFLATPSLQQFPNATVALTNTSSSGSYTYSWEFGDGSVSALEDPMSHTYGTWGSFTITLVVSTPLCSDTAVQTVQIDPPVPTVDFSGQGTGCVPLTVAFTNLSLGGLTFQWNFGDGGTSTAEHPIYVYNVPGTYSVTLTAFGLGGAVNTVTHMNVVVAHPRANAFFVLQPDEVVVPSQPVFIYNLSANASSYFWDLGDGTTSTETNPMHYYTEPGTYDVMLIANNEWNCPDTFLLEQATTGIVAGDILFPNAFTPANNGPTDGVYDPSSFENDFFFPVYDGVESYRLQVFNRWGEMVFESNDVRIGWDGYYRGQPAKQDVYAWKAWARFSDGRETTLSGDVTLLR